MAKSVSLPLGKRAGRAQARHVANRIIQSLERRSLSELGKQWLNYLRLSEKWEGKTPPRHLLEFRTAIAHEWEWRRRSAIVADDFFAWPSTRVDRGDGTLNGEQWYHDGLLSFLGYRVGETAGASAFIRRQILDLVQADAIPPVNGAAYMEEWGEPGSSMRLHKLANELASFVRNAKRKKSADMSCAIADWETDLNYLYWQYYVGKFGFVWPDFRG